MAVSLELVRPADGRAEVDGEGLPEPLRVEAEGALELLRELSRRRPEGIEPHGEHLTAQQGLTGCLACGHPELYTQRDFPRGVGIAIVVVAAVLAPATNYLSLLGAALVDAVLYRFAGRMVVCYVCGARHRGFEETPRHPSFDREIEERLRYGAKAVMGKPMRPGGTADAPEPHH